MKRYGSTHRVKNVTGMAQISVLLTGTFGSMTAFLGSIGCGCIYHNINDFGNKPAGEKLEVEELR